MSEPTRQVCCLGHRIEALTLGEAVERCAGWCRSGGPARNIVPLNAAVIVAADGDPELRLACDSADLRLADGASLLWAARLGGERLPERVAGIDLMQRLVERADRQGFSVFFLGARQAVVERLVEIYRKRYPTLRIAGWRDGYFDKSAGSQVVEHIRASHADILFIGMPTPFKEIWAQQHRDQLGVNVILGVGGSFDVSAGFIRRAPRFVQKLGFEWFWRLVYEPRRLWKRYLIGNSRFVLMVIAAMVQRRRRLRQPPRNRGAG